MIKKNSRKLSLSLNLKKLKDNLMKSCKNYKRKEMKNSKEMLRIKILMIN